MRRFPRHAGMAGVHRKHERVFPDRPIVDIPDNDPIFHTIYDLDDRYQVPGAQYLYSGRLYEKDGYRARAGAGFTTTRAG